MTITETKPETAEQDAAEDAAIEWSMATLRDRVAGIGATRGWNNNRVEGVYASLVKFTHQLGDITSAEQAGDAAYAAVLKDWPGWTGMRTGDMIRALGRELYESTWRPEPPDVGNLDESVATLPGIWSREQRRIIRQAIEGMAADKMTFDSDGARWKELRLRARRISERFHAEYSDVVGSRALSTLLRTVFPNTNGDMPAHIAAMNEEEAKATLVTHEARERAAHEELWRKAEERQWCPEFDAILIRAGYPPRPRAWNIHHRVTYRQTLTHRRLSDAIGQPLTFDPPTAEVTHEGHADLRHAIRASEAPTAEQAAEMLTPEVVAVELRDHGVGNHLVLSVQVTRVDP